MTHPNAALIEKLYTAFQKKDGDTMAGVYSGDARFSDPVFQELKGPEVGAMWRMLCKRGKDLEVTFSDVEADDATGKAYWEARYTFSGGGKVHNKIHASFRFKDGCVVEHKDSFDLKAWCGMALGLKGKLLGGTAFMQNAIRKQAMSGLRAFMTRDG